MADSTNVWGFLLGVAQVLGPIAATVVTYLLTRRGQDPKLDEIHTAVNGKSDKQDQRIAELEAHIEDLKRDGRGPV